MPEVLPRPSESNTISSSASLSTTGRRGPINFSRPRPTEPFRPLHRDAPSQVHVLEAFHQSSSDDDDRPAEPRVPLDASPPVLPDANPILDLAWDDESGEVRSQHQPSAHETAPPPRSLASNSGSTTIAPAHVAKAGRSSSSSSSTTPRVLDRDPRAQIVKRVSVTQRSERESPPPPPATDWEDAASHHTVSELGDGPRAGQSLGGAKWTGSDYDTSGLTEAELRKLRKKGINPALYAEMKAARKGRGKLSPLVGNPFLG